MADIQEVKSKRDMQLERMRKKYPEKKFEDDEEVYGQIYDDYDQYEQDLDRYKKDEKSMAEMFNADPRSGQFLADWHNGKDPVIELVRKFGVEIRDVLDSEEMQEKIAEANKEYVERVAKSKALDEEYSKNMDVTLETLRQFQEEKGMTDEQMDEVVSAMFAVVNDGIVGKFDKSTIELFVNAINHDKDVAVAGEEGMVAGRNAKIVEGLRKSAKGDGTAPLSGKNGDASGKSNGGNIFDLAYEAM
jgi:hypothetical protein